MGPQYKLKKANGQEVTLDECPGCLRNTFHHERGFCLKCPYDLLHPETWPSTHGGYICTICVNLPPGRQCSACGRVKQPGRPPTFLTDQLRDPHTAQIDPEFFM